MRLRLSVVGLALLAALSASGCGDGDKPRKDSDLPGAVLKIDRNPDPEVLAWAGCLETVTQCLEAGGQVKACTTAKACGADCVSALDRALVGATGRDAELDAFETVFIAQGAACRPAGKGGQ
jgi:hypothetical protein